VYEDRERRRKGGGERDKTGERDRERRKVKRERERERDRLPRIPTAIPMAMKTTPKRNAILKMICVLCGCMCMCVGGGEVCRNEWGCRHIDTWNNA